MNTILSGNLFADSSAAEILATIGLLLAIAEVFVPGFVLLPLGLAFLVTAIVALLTTNWLILITVLAMTEVILFFVSQKYIRKNGNAETVQTTAQGMLGKEGVVTEDIEINGTGYVKLYGDQWQAKCQKGTSILKGTRVIIVGLDGNKVIVSAIGNEGVN